MDDAQRREQMIETQLRPGNVTEPSVLGVMAKVPREAFLPAALRGVAYTDDDLLLPDGRFLVEPLVLGRLLELAEIQPEASVLVVGCDTGYTAVVASGLCGTVFTAVDPGHMDEVNLRCGQLEADNVLVSETARPLDGLPANAPYDVIIAVGQVNLVPPGLLDQLQEEGRLVAVVNDHGVGRGSRFTKMHGRIVPQVHFDAAIPRMRATEEPASFSF